MYRVIIKHKAAKEIEFLPGYVLQSVYDAIEDFKIHPRPRGVKKLIGHDGWRIRVHEYRVLYTIDDKQKLITVYRIKHRKDVYR